MRNVRTVVDSQKRKEIDETIRRLGKGLDQELGAPDEQYGWVLVMFCPDGPERGVLSNTKKPLVLELLDQAADALRRDLSGVAGAQVPTHGAPDSTKIADLLETIQAKYAAEDGSVRGMQLTAMMIEVALASLEGRVWGQKMPDYCFSCGAHLEGGATDHREGCEILKLIHEWFPEEGRAIQ